MNGQLPPQDAAVRVLVVDDQLASVLRIQDGIEIAGTTANGQEAIERALILAPDMIVLDVRLPVLDGVQAAELLDCELPSWKILMLTPFDDEDSGVKALNVGASGYVLTDMPARDLAQAVHAVRRGISQFDPAVMNRMISALAGERTHPPVPASPATILSQHASLTGREREGKRLRARGATNREIAEALVISEGTVKNPLSNMLSRLG